jgi:hypothetical protein
VLFGADDRAERSGRRGGLDHEVAVIVLERDAVGLARQDRARREVVRHLGRGREKACGHRVGAEASADDRAVLLLPREAVVRKRAARGPAVGLELRRERPVAH